MGNPWPSVTAITLLPLPIFVLPTPAPPFSPRETPVQEGACPLRLALGVEPAQQYPPNPLPGSICRPRAKTPPAGRRRAVHAEHIFPCTAGLQHKEHVVERAAIVVPFPAGASFLHGDEGLDNDPLFISNIMSTHAHSLAWAHRILKWLVIMRGCVRGHPDSYPIVTAHCSDSAVESASKPAGGSMAQTGASANVSGCYTRITSAVVLTVGISFSIARNTSLTKQALDSARCSALLAIFSLAATSSKLWLGHVG
jgi:hypothetical protein